MLLTVDDLVVTDGAGVNRVKNVSLSVRRGEIVGVAGVSGNGQSQLLAALAGTMQPASGQIRIGDRDVSADGPVDAAVMRRLGAAHVPEDRIHEGLVTGFQAWQNFILGYHRDPAYNGSILLDTARAVGMTASDMKSYDIRPDNPWLKAANFSGGNQQKLIAAREIERDPDLLLVGQPTRGVDIGAIEFIHRRLIEMRDKGKAILLVSVELDEILSLSDRIVVMFDGMLVGEVPRDKADERTLGLMMAGIRPDESPSGGQATAVDGLHGGGRA